MSEDISPADQLQEWLQDGRLASQYTALEAQIKSDDSSHYYAVMTQQKGWRAIKAELDARRASDFAERIAPVAWGMYVLASADADRKYVTFGDDNATGTVLPTCYELSEPSKMVVMSNRSDDRTFGRLDSVFAPGGRHGLKMVTLRVGCDRLHGNPAAVLDLVLPRWTRGSGTIEAAYVVVSVELTGLTGAHVYELALSEDAYLERTLGINSSRRRLVSRNETVGYTAADIDEIVGYPGVLNTLANDLFLMPQYFKTLAEKLRSGR